MTALLAASVVLALGEPPEAAMRQAEAHMVTCRDIVADDPRGGVERWMAELGRRVAEDAREEGGGAAGVAYRRELVMTCYGYWSTYSRVVAPGVRR